MPMTPVFILGRFPPPLDGQSLATARLADLLESTHEVTRVNTEPDDGVTASDTKFRPSRVAHYLRLRDRIREALGTYPDAPVIWTSVSSTSLGHWRDVTATLAVIEPSHPIIAVSHRANLDAIFQSSATAGTAKRMTEQVDRFVFLTEEISSRCSPWIPSEKRLTIPNTIDDDVLCADEEVADRRPPDVPFRLLFLSNMMPEKGHSDVLEAVAIVGESVLARFVGAWPSDSARADFIERAHALGVAKQIEVTGAVSARDRIKSLFLESDAFVLPTYHPTEGMPLTILEAMNAGTPVIATRAGGIPEMIEDRVSGLFVSPRSPAEIAKSIRHLQDPESWKRLSAGARAQFLQRFHPDAIRSRWEEVLAEVSA